MDKCCQAATCRPGSSSILQNRFGPGPSGLGLETGTRETPRVRSYRKKPDLLDEISAGRLIDALAHCRQAVIHASTRVKVMGPVYQALTGCSAFILEARKRTSERSEAPGQCRVHGHRYMSARD